MLCAAIRDEDEDDDDMKKYTIFMIRPAAARPGGCFLSKKQFSNKMLAFPCRMGKFCDSSPFYKKEENRGCGEFWIPLALKQRPVQWFSQGCAPLVIIPRKPYRSGPRSFVQAPDGCRSASLHI